MHHFLWWLEQVGMGTAAAIAFAALIYGMFYFSQYMADRGSAGKR